MPRVQRCLDSKRLMDELASRSKQGQKKENRQVRLGCRGGQSWPVEPAVEENIFSEYAGSSYWQDSILRRQVKISTCPCARKPARVDRY